MSDEERGRERERADGSPASEESASEAPQEQEPAGAPPARPRRRLRQLRRVLLWATVAVVLVGAQLFLLVESDRFSEWARQRVVDYLQARLDCAITIESLDFDLLPTSVEARGVMLAGTLPDGPPLARVDRVTADLVIRRPWPLSLSVRRLEIERPRIELRSDEDGEWNLPHWQRQGGAPAGEGRASFEIGGLEVLQGELVIDEERLPFELAAGAVRADLVGLGGTRVRGEASLRDVVLALPGADPVAVSLAGKLEIDAGKVVLERARLSGPHLESALGVVVEWRDGPPRVRVEVDARAQAELARRLGYFDSDLAGQLRVLGQFNWRSRRGAAFEEDGEDFEAWRFEGSVASDSLTLEQLELAAAQGLVIVEPDGLVVRLDDGELAGGAVEGQLELSYGSSAADGNGAPGRLALTVDGASLASLVELAGLPVHDLGGAVSGHLDYRFEPGDVLAGVGLADLTVEAQPTATGRRPVRGTVPLVIDNGILSTEAASFELPSQSLFVSGSWQLASRTARASVELRSADLPALVELLRVPSVGAEDRWSTPTTAHSVSPGESAAETVVAVLRGRGEVRADVELAPESRVVAEVDYRLADVEVATEQAVVSADTANGGLLFEGRGASGWSVSRLLANLEQGGGILRSEGAVESTSDPTPSSAAPTSTLRASLSLEAADFPIAGLVRSRPDLSGRLNGRGRLDWSSPAGRDDEETAADQVEMQARIRIADLVLAGTALGALEGEWALSGRRLELYDGTLETAAGVIGATGSLDLAAQSVQLAVRGDDLDLGQGPFADFGLDAVASISATVRGTLPEPLVEARVDSVPAGSVGSAAPGSERGEVEPTVFTLRWDGQQLAAAGEVAGLVSVDGGGRLDRDEIDLSFEINNDDLSSLIRTVIDTASRRSGLADPDSEGLDDRLTSLLAETEGRFAGRFEVAGLWSDIANPLELEDSTGRHLASRLVLDTLVTRLRDREIRNLEPVEIRLGGDSVHIASLFLSGPDGMSELFVNGEVDFASSPPRLDLRLDGSVSGHWVEELYPGVRVEGVVDFLGVVKGTALAPQINGQAGAEGGRVTFANLPHSFENIAATVLFYPERAVLDSLRTDFADGRVRGSGSLVWPTGEVVPPAAPPRSRISLQARGEGMVLRVPEPWTVRGNAELSFRQDADGQRILVGTVDLQEALYRAQVDLGIAQLFRNLTQRSRVEVVQVDETLDSIRLDLDVNGPDALGVSNNLADLQGDVDLLVQGTLARPIAFGSVELEPGSTLDYGGDSYEISRGGLTFADPYRIDPLIDLVATTRRRDFDIVLNLSGTRDDLEAHLSSDPPLPQLEVFDLLASGTPLGGGGGGAVTASDLIYTQTTALVEGRVTNLFGLDRFRLDPLRSGDGLSSARVTLGKRISKDLFVTYSVDPSSTDDSVVELEWRIADNLVLIFSQNTDGSYSVDARWEQTF